MFTGVVSAAQLALLDRLKEQRLLAALYRIKPRSASGRSPA